MTILLLAALLPPLFLMIKIYKLDKVEKEPGGLIVKFLIFGVLTTVPAAFLEGFLISLVGGVISPKTTLFILVENFFCVGLVEEGVKYFALKKGSWNHPAFNYTFDGIVYAVAVSIGFATAENVLYVMEYGLATAGVRAVTSIPGHCIFAIYMGISFSLAKYCEVHGNLSLRKKHLRNAIRIPMLLHGFYDFCASMKEPIWTIIFLVFIVALDVVAYKKVNEMERQDRPL